MIFAKSVLIFMSYKSEICRDYFDLSVNGLQCWQCDTFTHPDGCWGDKANKTGSMCLDHEDVCIKIVTKYQMPHHGPRNRTAEKEMDSKSTCPHIGGAVGSKLSWLKSRSNPRPDSFPCVECIYIKHNDILHATKFSNKKVVW